MAGKKGPAKAAKPAGTPKKSMPFGGKKAAPFKKGGGRKSY